MTRPIKQCPKRHRPHGPHSCYPVLECPGTELPPRGQYEVSDSPLPPPREVPPPPPAPPRGAPLGAPFNVQLHGEYAACPQCQAPIVIINGHPPAGTTWTLSWSAATAKVYLTPHTETCGRNSRNLGWSDGRNPG